MNFTTEFISYESTGAFSKMVNDYVAQNNLLNDFYAHAPTLDGIKSAIQQRKNYHTDRVALVNILTEQYKNFSLTVEQQNNLQQLSNTNTFTITTAHQPNIFTGQLYFIYKILHVIKLANHLKEQLPQHNFVPVYYMGSEDADLEELNNIYIDGVKYEWQTNQTGAVGRMKVDKALLTLIDAISGQVLVQPFGAEIVNLLKDCYQLNTTIEQATFKLVNSLFAKYGLLVFLPDTAAVKKVFAPILQKELVETFSDTLVKQTAEKFPKQYKVQASGRALNLFYLNDNIRERIEKINEEWITVSTQTKFNQQQILEELKNYPERFSPNVILRPVMQEAILPNVAFIGGGGEIAYWLELKQVFDAVKVPYPVLVLRNSFTIINADANKLKQKLQLSNKEIFKNEFDLLNDLVKEKTGDTILSLANEKAALETLYQKLIQSSTAIDATLLKHTTALKVTALKKLDALEKKMLKAEKLKYEAEQRQIKKLKLLLFPNNNLQERVENLIIFYAKWGGGFIDELYKNSLGLQMEFGVITEIE
jgi:bacillithiol synthase